MRNRTAQTVTAPANSLSISATTNRITSGGFAYDASGNMTNDALNTYTYDAENRIKTVNGSGATYSYDGASQRVKKVVGGTTTRYIFSGTRVIAEYVNGALSKEYIYSGSKLLVTLTGSTPTYHHSDHLSARVNTNSSGTTVGQQGHYPFGESWYMTSTTTKWQFTSYECDAESTLDYAIFRYDNSRLGRFMTPDLLAGSIFNPQSLNRYAYTRNDPINLIDPLGLAGEPAPGTCEQVCVSFAGREHCTIRCTGGGGGLLGGGGGRGGEMEIVTGSTEQGEGARGLPGGVPIGPVQGPKTEAEAQLDCANEVVTELFNKEVIPNLRIQAALTSVQSTVDPNSNKIKFDFTLDNTVPAREFPTSRPGTAPALEIYKKTISLDFMTKTTSGRGDLDPNNPRFRPFRHLRDILVEHLGGKLPAPCDLLRRLRNQ